MSRLSPYKVKDLRKLVIDLPFKLCDKTSDENYSKKFCFPKTYADDLKFLCEQYGTKLRFGGLRKRPYSNRYHYEHTWDKYGNCVGYESEIFLYVDERDKILTSHEICTEFTHELAHHLQHMILIQNRQKPSCEFKKRLEFERVATRMAYFIYKQYFEHLFPDLTHRNFTSYRKKETVEWFRKWCGEVDPIFGKVSNKKGCIKCVKH